MPAFGSTTFGASTPAFGSSGFGAASTPAFGSASPAPFGSPSATPAFGASTPAFGGGGMSPGPLHDSSRAALVACLLHISTYKPGLVSIIMLSLDGFMGLQALHGFMVP